MKGMIRVRRRRPASLLVLSLLMLCGCEIDYGDRVLDLTDPTVIRHLDLGDLSLIQKKERIGLEAYETTQQLGFLAPEHGLEAIFADSAQFPGNKTLTLLRDVSWKN